MKKREETAGSDRFPTTILAWRAALSAGTSLQALLAQLEARFVAIEPEIRAFVPEDGRFARLRLEAEALVARYPDPESRPPLFGVPVGVKDIFHVQHLPTQAGSRLPAGTFQGGEAAVVTALKKAGALIVGKTVTTEFAYFAPGPTRNPHNPAHTPGGSSSGSAAAVAAGLVPLALGTQTIGSLIRPAAYCGVVAFKPSYERISRAGVLPLAPSLDHVGFFTRTVADARRVAGILLAEWETPVVPAEPVLGIPRGPYLERAAAVGLLHFREVCERLGDAGYRLKPVSLFADFEAIDARHRQLMAAEAAQVHEQWYAEYGHLYAQETATLLAKGAPVAAARVTAARAGREALRAELVALMDAEGVDVWLSPAAPGPAPAGLGSTGDPVMNLPWTYAGLPVVTIPAGSADGLPLGLQLAGGWQADEALLLWAEQIGTVAGEPVSGTTNGVSTVD